MNSTRVQKLLETASRPTTPDHERLAAMNVFRGLADRAGGVDQVIGGGTVVPVTPTYTPYSAHKKEIAKLEEEISLLHEQLHQRDNTITQTSKLLRKREAEIESLKARLSSKPNVRPPNGTMSYPDFANEARRRLVNADRNWQMMFEKQTGLKRSRFARFCQIGRVDREEYIEALDSLRACTPPDRYTKAWTKAEVNRVRALTDEGETEKNIARIVSDEFGRRITENMLKRLKHNSRNGQGVFRDPSYGPPIGKTR